MISLIFFLACALAVLGIGGLAALSDFRGMKIPNVYSVLIGGAFVLCFGGLSVFGGGTVFAPLLSHVIGFAVVFVLTLIMFFTRVWGAGDQKLMSAFALWMGIGGMLPFLVYTALIGGVLGLVALFLQRFKPVAAPAEGAWVALVQGGEGKVPYGIAIFGGAVLAFLKLGYFSSDAFRILLS
ncbi:MAG: A24 family peptidase [Alphaproteobacteria bacterium]